MIASAPNFRILDLGYSSKVHTNWLIGNFSGLVSHIYIARDPRPYISQVYIPAFLLVVISWIPLWLSNRNSMSNECRVTFALTTVLTLTFLTSSYSATFPTTSYMKSIDTYLLVCFLMAFVTLVECSLVAFLVGRAKVVDEKQQKEVHILDRWARWIIPLGGLVYNAVYIANLYFTTANNSYGHVATSKN